MTAVPLPGRASLPTRWRAMARVAVRMMFHDKLKLMGTLFGVIFAVILSNQQAGTFLGLVGKNLMFVDNAGADLWIAPPGTETLQPGKTISDTYVYTARSVPGIAWAEPLLFAATSVSLPSGGSEAISLVGTRYPALKGGPWNVVAGDRSVVADPYSIVIEDSERDKLGGLNLGSVREIGGKTMRVGAFTWGLLPFGPSYAFTEFDTAREILHTARDQTHFVLVGVAPGTTPEQAKAALQQAMPDVIVFTKDGFRGSIFKYLMTRTGIGITFGTSTVFAVIVGFVIVALSMFSSVVDNIREFGTLKAIGATTVDLAALLWVQAVLFGGIGSLVGMGLVTRIADAARSPQLAMLHPPQLIIGTFLVMISMCVVASSLALVRVHRVEPAMVFR